MTKFFTRQVGPEEARELLAHNYDKNRNVRAGWVKALARMMRDGQFFAQNGDVIRIGRDGTLYDGQHRLHAVIESGTMQTFDFAEIDRPEDAFITMDNGAKRGAADFVKGPNKNERAAVAAAMYCIECGTAGLPATIDGKCERTIHPSRMDIVEYATANEAAVGSVLQQAKKVRQGVGAGPVKTYATFIYLVQFCDDGEELAAFIEDCCSDAPESPTTMAFVKAMSKAYLSGMRPTKNWYVSKLLAAYTHFKDSDGCTTLASTTRIMNKYDKMLQAARRAQREEV